MTVVTDLTLLPEVTPNLPSFDPNELRQYPNMTKRIEEAAYDGYWQPGWETLHYFLHAPKIKGFENCIIWGPKGSFKSTRANWINYNVNGRNWDTVWEYTVMHPVKFADLVLQPGRIPLLNWDDVASWLDSTLYFDDRDLYIKIKRYWWLLRTKISDFECSAPNKGRVAGFILDDMTCEMKCSPRMVFNYDRWAWKINVKNPRKVDMFPVNIETRRMFNYKFVEFAQVYDPELGRCVINPEHGTPMPDREWDKYWSMRLELSHVSRDHLIPELKSAFGDPPDTNTLVESINKNMDAESDAEILSRAATILGRRRAEKAKEDKEELARLKRAVRQ